VPLVLADGEGAGVAHHHLEQDDALGAGDEGAEVVALVERDVGARPHSTSPQVIEPSSTSTTWSLL
jgi:hypothetical protein